MGRKVAALDIGGTNTRVALVNDKFEIEKVLIRPTVVGNTELFLKNVGDTIEEALPSLEEVGCFAMGVPGRVRYDGYIYALPNVHIENVPLAEYLQERFGRPAYVINDAEAAALAEANIGAHKDEPSLYFVTISTGVGGALTVGGRLKSTSYEVGHTMMSYRGECHEFEHMCSGTGIVRLAAMNGLNVQSSREFFELKKNGHELAERVYRDWLRLFADWFRMLEETFSPGLFALTGGVMKSQDLFLEDMKAAVPGIRIEPCALGQEAGLLGAAVYGFQNI